MKMLKTLFFSLAFVGLSTAAYSKDFTVNSKKSKVSWYGSKIVGGSHNGTIGIKAGKLNVAKGTLKSGSIDIDMTSIVNLDISSEKFNKKLVGHLESNDFFGVKKHPVAKFTTTKVQPLKDGLHRVWGKMTIKGKTKDVDFLAKVDTAGKNVTARGEIKLDRTDFDVKYGSGKFFDDLGDKMISDEIKLNFELVAN